MKRRDLVNKITKAGAILIRHGGKHDWYQNPKTKMSQPVPRHTEIKEYVARSIIRKLVNSDE
jgi:predicted RNA binding protein YcfA (HicA-like mRNA interferase family)